MPLNDNNFIRFSGAFPEPPATVTVFDISALAFSPSVTSITCQPLLTAVGAPHGIDPYSFQIVAIDSASPVPAWDPVTGTLTIYRPYFGTPTTYHVTFTVCDKVGNQSNEGTITINLLASATIWRGYGPSYTCLIDTLGNRTGYAKYDMLEQVYAGTFVPVSPSTLKANNEYDADYIAPTYDPVTCVVPSHPYCPLTVANFTNLDPSFSSISADTNYAKITKLTLQKVGDTDIVYFLSVMPGGSVLINVPANNYSHIIVEYTVVGDPMSGIAGVTYHWKFSTNGSAPVTIGTFINTSPFDYGATTLVYPAGATIFVG